MKMKLSLALFVAAILISGCGSGDGSDSAAPQVTELEGTWVTDCLGRSPYNITVTVSKNVYSVSAKTYTSSVCSAETAIGEFYSESGKLAIGTAFTTGLGFGVKQLDMTSLIEDGVKVNDTEYDLFHISEDGYLFFGLETEVLDGSTAEKRPVELDTSIAFGTELEGDWVQDCVVGSYPYSTIIKFRGNTYTLTGMYHNPETCAVIADSTYTESGKIAVGAMYTTDSGVSAKKIDIFTLIVNGDPMNHTVYDLFHISAEDGHLYFGNLSETRDGSSEANRPTELDTSIGLRKALFG